MVNVAGMSDQLIVNQETTQKRLRPLHDAIPATKCPFPDDDIEIRDIAGLGNLLFLSGSSGRGGESRSSPTGSCLQSLVPSLTMRT